MGAGEGKGEGWWGGGESEVVDLRAGGRDGEKEEVVWVEG